MRALALSLASLLLATPAAALEGVPYLWGAIINAGKVNMAAAIGVLLVLSALSGAIALFVVMTDKKHHRPS